MLELARRGAEHRLAELHAEIVSLIKAFPHLRRARGGRRKPRIDVSAEPAATIDRPARKRRPLSAAGRRKISEAQKKRWARQKRQSKSPQPAAKDSKLG